MIDKSETEIRGSAHLNESADASFERIQRLTESYLKRIGATPDGWDVLYKDPSDGRFWELIYPQSELHGGGPPLLRWLSDQQARDKYVEVLGISL